MAAVAGRYTGHSAGEHPVAAYPLAEEGRAAGGVNAAPWIIEISDDDYRSFCFPCHALEEAESGSAGT